MELTYQEFTTIKEEILNPLFEVNNEVFSEFTTPFDKEKLQNTARKVDGLHIVLAYQGEQVVGFKAGYRHSLRRFYSWLGGVKKDFRGHGIAKELMRRQHQFAKNEGYSIIETRTKNMFQNMIITNLKAGFHIVGTTVSIGDSEPVLILEKILD